MLKRNLLIMAFLPLTLLSCSGEKNETGGETGDDTGETAVVECNTDNEECGPGDCQGPTGQNMLPGADCTSCHSDGNIGNTGPKFTIAGTVFEDGAGTSGFEGATLRILDAAGNTFELTSNSVGNFFTSQDISFPVNAEVEVNGAIRAMGSPIESGACNTCHTCDGAAGNKIFVP